VLPSLFLKKLRSETAYCHRALEENPSSKFLLSDKVTIHGVDQYLRTMYGFIKNFEKVIFPLLENDFPQLANRQKAHLLTIDLQLSPQDMDLLSVLSDSTFTTYYTNSCKAWGGMYVLEGSTLGGQIITKHLQHALGEAVSNKTHYFNPYGEETGSMWKIFLHHFSKAATKKDNQEEILNSAVQTFSLINNWMTHSSTKVL
jgi:heme oxygenase (biliverdin-IX-beta and delta-forming)